jgi:hypothetical protein
VVGWPLLPDGGVSAECVGVARFLLALRDSGRVQMPVLLRDERGSSVAARRVVAARGTSAAAALAAAPLGQLWGPDAWRVLADFSTVRGSGPPPSRGAAGIDAWSAALVLQGVVRDVADFATFWADTGRGASASAPAQEPAPQPALAPASADGATPPRLAAAQARLERVRRRVGGGSW